MEASVKENVSALSVVEPMTVGERVRMLQVEAKRLANEHMDAVFTQLREAVTSMDEIYMGGDAYPAGIRDEMSRIADHIGSRMEVMEAILAKRK